MTPAHPEAEALELYVIGAHDQVAVADVEAHLSACAICTEEVRRQAQVEMALAEMAAEAVFCPGCSAILTTTRCQACGAVAEVSGFRIERVIVENAHGRMYLARDQAGQAVALKELAFVRPPHPDAVAAFEREARLLRQIAHPQIPRFVAAFHDGEGVATRLYLAQEYVEGESLLARLAGHQFSEAEAVEVARQVLAILEYLQSLAPMVFHRDIKPSNLIRRPDGRIALVDFGAARDLGPTVGATLVGTFGYMPLEQMGGIVDATTDLYALGATLTHLLSRREPWNFLEDAGALERLNVSRGFRDFLGTLTARRPADRYPSAAAAATALREPIRRHPRRGERSGFRVRGLVAVMAGAGLLLGAGVALLKHREHRPVPRITVTRSTVKESVELGRASPAGPRLAIDPQDIRYRPKLSRRSAPAVRPLPGERISVGLRLCASESGQVTSASIEKSSGDPGVDAEVVSKLMRWKYEPRLVDGKPAPFCMSVSYSVEGTAAK